MKVVMRLLDPCYNKALLIDPKISGVVNTGLTIRSDPTLGVSLTATGQHYLEVCSRTLRDLEDEEDALASLHNEPRGTLKIVAVRALP